MAGGSTTFPPECQAAAARGQNLALSKGDSGSHAGTLQLLYTQHKKKDFGLLGHKTTNYVNSTQVCQTCLVPMKLVCSCAGFGPKIQVRHTSMTENILVSMSARQNLA